MLVVSFASRSWITIENPYDSHLWLVPVMVQLMEYIGSNGVLVQFDQCTYGLQLPGASKFFFSAENEPRFILTI